MVTFFSDFTHQNLTLQPLDLFFQFPIFFKHLTGSLLIKFDLILQR